MRDISNKETVSVRFVAADANRSPSRGGVDGSIVNAEIDLTIVGIDQALAAGGRFGLIGDVAMGRVGAGIEAEG